MNEVYETWDDVPAATLVKSKAFYAIKSAEGESMINSTRNQIAFGWIDSAPSKGPFWPVQERL